MASYTGLFGGAMKVQLPSNRVDVSDIRQVPDNQEVFAHPSTDQSMIIEVMEFQEAENDTEALRTYFEDLAETNSTQADLSTLKYDTIDLSVLSLQKCSSCHLLAGVQYIAKFKDQQRNCVDVNMALLRLPAYQTDLLITFNNPTFINPESSSHAAEPSGSSNSWKFEEFLQVVKSLQVLDYGLFG